VEMKHVSPHLNSGPAVIIAFPKAQDKDIVAVQTSTLEVAGLWL
jgi:hypothetical protein